ncbi:hypothetical protein KBX73_02975 [Acetobacter persici]|uniref:hypothetical protein n=1 Tax=Acetobacter persici TaxID=1076596 RepID=UPI0020CC5C5A|nr:hypothetical protein [Acetobacter persici]MCP9318754.1 hypothetical protein [Acetobacter persici]
MTSISSIFNKLCFEGIINEVEKDFFVNPSAYTFLTDCHVNAYGKYSDKTSIDFVISPLRMKARKNLNYAVRSLTKYENYIYETGNKVVYSINKNITSFHYDIRYKITKNGFVICDEDIPDIYREHIKNCDRLGLSYHPIDWIKKDHIKYKLCASSNSYDAFFC